MNALREIGLGLLGLGNVGSGVVRLLRENADTIEARLGARVVVRRIAVRDAGKQRQVDVLPGQLTTDWRSVVDDQSVDVVVETMGGEDPARDIVLRAIDRGCQVVTANKLLLALHGEELFSAARERCVGIHFEAAVCGGVPVIRALREGLASDRIEALWGVVNGTSNYILTRMAEERQSFASALAEAQAAGYAEADPRLDIDGIDAAHKLAILATLSFGGRIGPDEIHTEGISALQPTDFVYADRFGYAVKPIVMARAHRDGVEARAHPALVEKGHLLASVGGTNNAICVNSRALGESLYIGRGAGMMPTAVAVVSDVIEVSRSIIEQAAGASTTASRGQWPFLAKRPVREIGLLHSAYYLRFRVLDQPGVLGQLATILGGQRVSIAQLIQEGERERGGVAATVVALTHTALEKDVRSALDRIDDLPAVVEKTLMLRIVG
ncbi:MAG: homoserine dehydrogenase [Pseudomonadota bacterium]